MRVITLSLALVGLAACSAGPPATPEPTAIDPDEYAIYRRVLADDSQSAAVVVLAATDTLGAADVVAHLAEDPELQAAFVSATQVRGILTAAALHAPGTWVVSNPGLPAPATSLREQERRWEQLRAQYGAQVVVMQFSRVAFSRDRKRAMVFYVSQSGPACNLGVYGVVYQRVRGRWVPIANAATFC